MAYFDNAATTYPKPKEVYDFMDQFYRASGFSVGRGDHISAAALVEDTRKRIKDLLHCPNKQVIFTPTATIALNMIIQGLIIKGVKNVYISPFEHNAITRQLYHFETEGKITVKQLYVSKEFDFDLERIKYQFDADKPDLVIVSHVSNVIGLIAPVLDVFKLAKSYDSITLTDMAQSAGLVDIDVGSECIDFAVFAGHKTLYGPTGISGFVMKSDFCLPPVLFGGTGYDSANQNMPDAIPERYEMGTLNISGVAGLNVALKWIQDKTIPFLFTEEQKKREKLISLLSEYDFIEIIGGHPEQNYTGIVSILIDGISCDSGQELFNQFGISVRSGLQCAPFAHQFLNTYPSGTIRFSVSYFTTEKDLEKLKKALDIFEDNL